MNFLSNKFSCIWDEKLCSIKNLKKIYPNEKNNFYLDSIRNELSITAKNFNKVIPSYKCKKCECVLNFPWFNENFSEKIYTQIYPHHHKGWDKLLNFKNNKKIYYHGRLFNYIIKNYKIKNYAEFNCPFTGIFQYFIKIKKLEVKKFCSLIEDYFQNKISAGLNKKQLSILNKKIFLTTKKLNSIKNRFYPSTKFYLIYDKQNLSWGKNCNYKSINCKSYAEKLFNLKLISFSDKDSLRNIKYDLFGFYLTLDHTFEPNKILNYAFKNSKRVIINAHVNEDITKQHKYVMTKDFKLYLEKKNILVEDLTDKVCPEKKGHETYLLCSMKK